MKTRFSAACAVLGLSTLLACGDPPVDTTPAVIIKSPVTNQQLKACVAVEVIFQISGIDDASPVGTNGKKPSFQLEASQVMRAGFGRLIAYFDGTTSQGVAAKSSEPITVPGSVDQGFARPDQIVLPGARKITLSLFYNGEPPQPVVPSRSAEVTINVVPNTDAGVPAVCKQ